MSFYDAIKDLWNWVRSIPNMEVKIIEVSEGVPCRDRPGPKYIRFLTLNIDIKNNSKKDNKILELELELGGVGRKNSKELNTLIRGGDTEPIRLKDEKFLLNTHEDFQGKYTLKITVIDKDRKKHKPATQEVKVLI